MSADLLRRAAAKLREHAEAATPGPWRWKRLDHGDDDNVTYLIRGPEGDDRVTPIPLQTQTEDAGYFSQAEADVAFASLVDPIVVRAIAELLNVLSWFPSQADRTDLAAALAVARAVLREDGESE